MTQLSRKERNLELYPLVVAGDKAARDEMLRINLPYLDALVEKHITRDPNRAPLRDDLTSCGAEALWRAVDRVAAGHLEDRTKINGYLQSAILQRFRNAPRKLAKERPLGDWITHNATSHPTIAGSSTSLDELREELEQCCRGASKEPEEVAFMLAIVNELYDGAENVNQIAKALDTDHGKVSRWLDAIQKSARKRETFDHNDFRCVAHALAGPDNWRHVPADVCPICCETKSEAWEHCGSARCQEEYALREARDACDDSLAKSQRIMTGTKRTRRTYEPPADELRAVERAPQEPAERLAAPSSTNIYFSTQSANYQVDLLAKRIRRLAATQGSAERNNSASHQHGAWQSYAVLIGPEVGRTCVAIWDDGKPILETATVVSVTTSEPASECPICHVRLSDVTEHCIPDMTGSLAT